MKVSEFSQGVQIVVYQKNTGLEAVFHGSYFIPLGFQVPGQPVDPPDHGKVKRNTGKDNDKQQDDLPQYLQPKRPEYFRGL
jgi:hypothetical protein